MGNLGTVNNACGGNFYDSGGPAGNYNNGQNYIATFCAPPGQYISFDFSQFNLDLLDDLTVYNGPSTASALYGTFTGNNSPGLITSSLGGCITFDFFSGPSFTGAGWSASILCSTTPPSTGNDCGSASPFCTGTAYTFPNNTGVASLGAINCLLTTPNPVWYYMQIATAGNLDINIAQTNGFGFGIDVDFNLWGPFTSLSSGCNAIAAGTAPNVDCSFSPSPTEQANIPNAQPGEFFIMLLTNFSDQSGTISFTNTAGSTATTNCAILCSITDVTSSPSACNAATNTYSLTGQVTIVNPPTTGTLLISNSCGGSVILNPPFISPINYTLNGLLPTGAACNVTASFSADATCNFTQSYTSPASCGSIGLNCPQYASVASSPPVACGGQIYHLEVPNTACNGTISMNVVGNYGSTYGNEISWQITSNLTSAVVASGNGNLSGANFNIPVGPLNPAVVGNIFTLTIFDSFGDGFNGVGGTISVQQPLGTNIMNPITGNFLASASNIFGANIAISPATITITTPTGPVVATVNNCKDFNVAITLQNTNYCSTTTVNLPWTIVCQATGAVISSGSTNVTVYPNTPTSASDLVNINFDNVACQWVVTPQSGCSLSDIGTIFTISPNPLTLPPPTCGGGGQTFQVQYNGIAGSPNCCGTAGPLIPTIYSLTFAQGNLLPSTSPFWNASNHAAYLLIPPYNAGGTANSLTLNLNMTGYCFNQPGPNFPANTSYWITIIVDGQIVSDQLSVNPGPTNYIQTLNLSQIPGGYDETSIIEVYIYPNTFAAPFPPPYTVFNPNATCPITNAQDGTWTGNISASITATFNELTTTPGICDFSPYIPIACCTPGIIPDANTTICSGESLFSLTTWTNTVNSANPNCVVFSSVTPDPGNIIPDNIFPSGINNSAVSIQQTISAYSYCDSNGDGIINTGDTYTLISTFVLTVNPDPITTPIYHD